VSPRNWQDRIIRDILDAIAEIQQFMRAMRNRIVHVHFRMDEKLMWDTIQNDLPPLVPELERLL
jgi:uncharacterized protein with HEPN domain